MLSSMPNKASSSSPGAARMRLLRQRRREGAICVTVELFQCEIDCLVRQGLLPDHARDREVLAHAVGRLIEHWFRRSSEGRSK
jgi:hypothetical protein